jgi:hypothetical protein
MDIWGYSVYLAETLCKVITNIMSSEPAVLISDIAANIVADILFWIVGGIGVMIWLRTTTIRRFRAFFGLDKNPHLVIYLSNMTIEGAPKSATSGADSGGYETRPNRSIALEEHWAAQSILRLFASAPARVPGLVRGLVDEFLLPCPTKVMTEISPGTLDGMPATNIITIGSDKHNSVTRYCLRLDPYLELDKKNRCVQVLKGPNKGQVLRRDTTGSLAVLERIRVADGGPVIFCCVGEHSVSSWQIAEYLAYNWQYLYKQWGDSSFALCFQYGDPDILRNMQQYVCPRLALGTYPKE